MKLVAIVVDPKADYDGLLYWFRSDKRVNYQLNSEPLCAKAQTVLVAFDAKDGRATSLLADRSDLVIQAQMMLARDPSETIRLKLAGNECLLPEAAAILAADKDFRVAEELALSCDSALSLETQMRLARHEDYLVRRALAGNHCQRLYPAVVAELACDPNPNVRLKAVEHNTIPAFSPLAFRVACDRSPRVRRAAVEAGRLTQQRGTLATELPMRLQRLPIKQSAERAVGVEEPETGEVTAL
jgi:hypothetical protein